MSNRRNFIKTTLLVASGLAVSGTAFAKGNLPAGKGGKTPKFSGIIYSENDEGYWEGKAGSHAPKITINGSNVTILTEHGMSDRHFIVRHTLVTPQGEVLGTRTFYPNEDEKAVSTHDLPAGFSGKLYATSFCNKHDFWVTEFEV